jgi:hypothetical protein
MGIRTYKEYVQRAIQPLISSLESPPSGRLAYLNGFPAKRSSHQLFQTMIIRSRKEARICAGLMHVKSNDDRQLIAARH